MIVQASNVREGEWEIRNACLLMDSWKFKYDKSRLGVF